jgi:hypothetical protein
MMSQNLQTSNFKEFENVVITIEEEAKQGMLQGSSYSCLLITRRSAVQQKHPSRKLFNLIVRFQKVQMVCDADIIVSHVTGSRMIAQVTDGVSRRLLMEGVTTGLDMLSFMPLHLSATDRRPETIPWILSWLGENAEILTPDQWFTRGHGHDGGYYDDRGFWRLKISPGKFVWLPPPAAADGAVEELHKSMIKQRDSTHVFICPQLLTPQWQRQLNKACDLVVFMNAGSEV